MDGGEVYSRCKLVSKVRGIGDTGIRACGRLHTLFLGEDAGTDEGDGGGHGFFLFSFLLDVRYKRYMAKVYGGDEE